MVDGVEDGDAPSRVGARRAISTAYYALLHCACINLAWTAAPGGSDSTRWRLCRTFDHGSIHTVANWVAPATGRQKSLPKPVIKGLVEQVADRDEIQTFAEVFDRLKQRRHDADYDHMTVFGHENARQAVREAGAAIEALNAVYGGPSWQIFTSLVLLTSKVTDR